MCAFLRLPSNSLTLSLFFRLTLKALSLPFNFFKPFLVVNTFWCLCYCCWSWWHVHLLACTEFHVFHSVSPFFKLNIIQMTNCICKIRSTESSAQLCPHLMQKLNYFTLWAMLFLSQPWIYSLKFSHLIRVHNDIFLFCSFGSFTPFTEEMMQMLLLCIYFVIIIITIIL